MMTKKKGMKEIFFFFEAGMCGFLEFLILGNKH